MKQNITLVEYHNHFADNFTSYAYAKMLEEQNGQKCCFVNNKTRDDFENKMSCFQMEYSYISLNRANEIAKKANEFNRYFIDKRPKNRIVKTRLFNINDVQYLSKSIIKSLNFKDTNFILNYDILEEITNSSSIGLYINSQDIKQNTFNVEFVNKAIKRLNKYIKQPKLFIFTDYKDEFEFNFDIDFKLIQIDDYKEEFELLKSCKHKIILNTSNSYSEGFWASVLNEKEYYLVAFDKQLMMKKKKRNWLAI